MAERKPDTVRLQRISKAFWESAALMSAEADAGRTALWVRGQMLPYWNKEVRIRQEALTRAKSQLTIKQHEKEGEARTTVDERKAVEKAKRRLTEAEEKYARTQSWARKLEKAQDDFRGAIGAFKTILDQEMPKALARLDHAIGTLDAYTKIKSKAPSGHAPKSAPDAAPKENPA